MKPINIPLIKKIIPVLTAPDIIGTTPLSSMPRFRLQEKHKEDVPDGFVVVDMNFWSWDILDWIATQDTTKWRESKINHELNVYMRYIISEDLYTLMALKFS